MLSLEINDMVQELKGAAAGLWLRERSPHKVNYDDFLERMREILTASCPTREELLLVRARLAYLSGWFAALSSGGDLNDEVQERLGQLYRVAERKLEALAVEQEMPHSSATPESPTGSVPPRPEKPEVTQ